jgi:16S rRNA (guanine966-N2)-methyltransferase
VARRKPAGRPTDGERETGLRIIAGENRGTRLKTPPGHLLRPMRDQVRGALFNILGAETVAGARVLDLFSGSGSLGLEAISRGAARAVCIDNNPVCLDVLRENVAKLRADDRVDVRRYDLARGSEGLAQLGPFDLVFMHPPFELLRRPPGPGEADPAGLLAGLVRAPGALAPAATVAFETPREVWRDETDVTRHGLVLDLRREYGSTALFVTHV